MILLCNTYRSTWEDLPYDHFSFRPTPAVNAVSQLRPVAFNVQRPLPERSIRAEAAPNHGEVSEAKHLDFIL